VGRFVIVGVMEETFKPGWSIVVPLRHLLLFGVHEPCFMCFILLYMKK